MGGVLVIIIVAAGITAFEVPVMLRKKLKKELWAFSFLMVLGTFFSLINAFNVTISNPLGWMVYIYKPISDMVNAWLT